MRRAAAALAALLASGAADAQGDPLAEVRAALGRFTGNAPVKATVERAVTVERNERPLESGRVTLHVSGGPDGVAIRYPAALLEALRVERADPDPEKPRPYRRALEDFDAIDAADLLNAAPALLADLDGATVKGTAAESHAGMPARRLDLELVVRTSRADSKWMKRAARTLKLWIAPDGVPLASELQHDFQVGLLFFTFDGKEARTTTYARAGDRLLAARRHYRFVGKGLGEDQHIESETALRTHGS